MKNSFYGITYQYKNSKITSYKILTFCGNCIFNTFIPKKNYETIGKIECLIYPNKPCVFLHFTKVEFYLKLQCMFNIPINIASIILFT